MAAAGRPAAGDLAGSALGGGAVDRPVLAGGAAGELAGAGNHQAAYPDGADRPRHGGKGKALLRGGVGGQRRAHGPGLPGDGCGKLSHRRKAAAAPDYGARPRRVGNDQRALRLHAAAGDKARGVGYFRGAAAGGALPCARADLRDARYVPGGDRPGAGAEQPDRLRRVRPGCKGQ